jgi:ankyrin repeat protein
VGDVRRWLRDGADVNHLDERTGFGALHHAAWNGHVAVVRVLLAQGADATLCNHMGETAADSARAAGNGAITALLYESAERGGSVVSSATSELPPLPALPPAAVPTSPPPPPPPPPSATAEEEAWRAAFDAALASATPLSDAALAAEVHRLLRVLA